MRMATALLRLAILIPVTAVLARAADADIETVRRSFENPPDDARIMMRWWWFGPGVTKAEIERELRAMKAGGMGGAEVQPVYPMALDDPATASTTSGTFRTSFSTCSVLRRKKRGNSACGWT
jgi:hypothetical protein